MILNIIYVAVIVVLLFGATIFAHELGHFIAARLLGMTVEVFSIGFGPAIWKRKIGSVTYQVASIPIGGYVALPQMDPELGLAKNKSGQNTAEPADPDEAQPLPRLPAWKKIVVSLSGPAGNIALAVLLAWIVFWVGKPSTPAEHSAVIGFVEPESEAYKEGIRTGDEIITVNRRSVVNWNEVLQENAKFDLVQLALKRNGEIITVSVPTTKNTIGFRTVEGLSEVSICKIESVDPDSSAESAGIMAGDTIKSLDGAPVLSIRHLVDLVAARADEEVKITLERSGVLISSVVKPRFRPELERAVIGVRFDPMAFDYDMKAHVRPGLQLLSHATAILRVVRSLITPKEARATSEGLGGPFIILFMFVEMVQRSLAMALWFTCFLNVNLAILNLLPIPILDGGHVLFSVLELLFRRPLHPKIVLWLSHIFAGLLIIVFVLLSGRDLQRIAKLLRLFPKLDRSELIEAAPAEE